MDFKNSKSWLISNTNQISPKIKDINNVKVYKLINRYLINKHYLHYP